MRLPISAAAPVIGPITPMLMVPVPLLKLPVLVAVLLQAASADNAVTPAAVIRRFARERPDKDLSDKREVAGGRLAAAGAHCRAAVCRAVVCPVLVAFVRCPDLIGPTLSWKPRMAAGGLSGRPFRPERRDHGVVVTTA
jgi:hypothetical protein